MTDPKDHLAIPELELSDFAALFADEDGVDQILAAISWLERAELAQRGASEPARAMEEAVRNAPHQLVEQLEVLIRESAAAFKDGDPDLAETAMVDAWDLLVLRDRLEDLRLAVPELLDAAAVAALGAFDAALDRADLWLEDLDDARLQMGAQEGKAERRWWRPREDFGSAEWDLPAAAHPDNWVPDDAEIAAWRQGKLAPLRAAAVSRYVARPDAAVRRWTGTGTGEGGGAEDTTPPVGDVAETRSLAPGVEACFMSLEAPLDLLQVDLTQDAGGVALVTAAGEQRPLVRHTDRVWWIGDLESGALAEARLVVFKSDGTVVADVSLAPLADE